jgi:NitT/TauT family transport system substrate-binding protein
MNEQAIQGKAARRTLISVALILVIGAIAGVLGVARTDAAVSTRGGGTTATNSSAKALKTLHFAIVSPQIQPAIMNHWIGKYLGYFKQEGIDADIQTSPGAAATLQELLSGQLDVAIGTLETLYAAQSNGVDLPLKLFYQYQMVSAYQIAVDPSSPIQKVPDFRNASKPLKIGVISTAETGYFYARALLARQGINPDKQVNWVALGAGPALLDAVKSHSVDAVAAFTSLYAIWHTQGYDVRKLPQPDKRIHAIGNAFLMAKNKDLADPTMRKYLIGYARAVAKATAFGIANPNVACRIHFTMYPQTLSPSISYLQNIADCEYIWRDRMQQYNPHTAGLKMWGGPINGDQIALYAAILGYGGNLDTDSLFTNYLLKSINKGINEKAITKQAKNYCKVASHKALCTKKS